MRARPDFDPELKAGLAVVGGVFPPTITPDLIPFMRRSYASAPIDETLAGRRIERSEHVIPGHRGDPIALSVLRPEGASGARPGVLFVHSGGLMFGDRFSGADLVMDWVDGLGAVLVTVEYRLAPEFAAPPPPDATCTDGVMVWLDRAGPAHANDAIILERLAMAVRIRHGRTRAEPENRRDLGVLLDPSVPAETRRTVAAKLSLSPSARYRVVAAPLFAVWEAHPSGPEDVVATPFGPIHALVLPYDHEPVRATPTGIGLAAAPEHLAQSFRSAIVALRLCEPPETPSVSADRYGGLVGLLADTPDDAALPDVDLVGDVMGHPWGAATLDALVRAGSVRQAARLAGVHHSTLQTRLDVVVATLGFDPFDGIGRTRLGIAFLMWRLRNSRVLDLPAPGRRSG